MTIDQIATIIKDTGNVYVRVYAGTRHSRNRLPALNTSDYFGKEEEMDVDKTAGVFTRVCADMPPGNYVVTMKRNRQAKDETERELYMEIGPQTAAGIAGPAMAQPAANVADIEARITAQFEARFQEMKHEQEKKELDRKIKELQEEVKASKTWDAKLSGLLDYAAEAYLPRIIASVRQPQAVAITGFSPEAVQDTTEPEEAITGAGETTETMDEQATAYLNEISGKIGMEPTLDLLRKLSLIDADGLRKLVALEDRKIFALLMMF